MQQNRPLIIKDVTIILIISYININDYPITFPETSITSPSFLEGYTPRGVLAARKVKKTTRDNNKRPKRGNMKKIKRKMSKKDIAELSL
jgi:hypothetical protein